MRHLINNYVSFSFLSYIIVVYGFYIGPVRSDQLFIYIYFLTLFFTRRTAIYTLKEYIIFSLLIMFIIIGVINYAYYAENRPLNLFVSQLENYLSLFAIYFIWIKIFKKLDVSKLITIQKVYIYTIASVSTLTILAQLSLIKIPTIFHNAIVTQRDDVLGEKLIDILVVSGRHPGVFGQVFEAGVAYSIALVLIFIIGKYFHNRYITNLLSILILAGGLIAGSKIFIITTIIIAVCWSLQSLKKFILFLIVIFSALCFVYFGNLELPWQFKRLITNITWSNVLHVYTSFRFFEGSTIVSGMESIVTKTPLGLGFGYLDNSDFSLYEVLSIGGIIGIIIYILVILLIYCGVKYKSEIFINCFIIFFLITASISAPVITANKINYIILISFLSMKRILSTR